MADEHDALIPRMVEIFENNNRDGQVWQHSYNLLHFIIRKVFSFCILFWLIDRLIDWLIDRLIDWLVDFHKEILSYCQSLIGESEAEMVLKGLAHCVRTDEAVGQTVAKILVEELKNALTDESDHSRLLKQLQLFLFLLKREIQDVLRKRSIKPHWMFAFDNMISKAVQTMLQQMGVSFDDDGDDGEPDRRDYTPQTSTSINSGSHGHHAYDSAATKLGKIQEGSAVLVEQLIAAELRYQELLRRTLQDKWLVDSSLGSSTDEQCQRSAVFSFKFVNVIELRSS